MDDKEKCCFECFKAVGEMKKCIKCIRIFHVTCLKTDLQRKLELAPYDTNKNYERHVEKDRSSATESLCYACHLIEKALSRKEPQMTKEEINYLVKMVFNYVINRFSRCRVDLSLIKDKIQNQMYECLEELLVDILDIRFQVALKHGIYSAQIDFMQSMFAESLFEIEEAVKCPDCFRQSNEKFDDIWFVKPCAHRKHKLVYAKVTGQPYWPAKVIMEYDNEIDVRFFGEDHSRAIIKKQYIRPIWEDVNTLNNGKTSEDLEAAIVELNKHLDLLTQGGSEFLFDGEKEKRDRAQKQVFEPKIEQNTVDYSRDAVTPDNIYIESISTESQTDIDIEIARKIEINLLEDSDDTMAPSPKRVFPSHNQIQADLCISDDDDSSVEIIDDGTVKRKNDFKEPEEPKLKKPITQNPPKPKPVNDPKPSTSKDGMNAVKEHFFKKSYPMSSPKKLNKQPLEKKKTDKPGPLSSKMSARVINLKKFHCDKEVVVKLEPMESLEPIRPYLSRSKSITKPAKIQTETQSKAQPKTNNNVKRTKKIEKMLKMCEINKRYKREEKRKSKKSDIVDQELGNRFRHIKTCLDLIDDKEKLREAALKLIKIQAEIPLKTVEKQKKEIESLKKKLWCKNCYQEVNCVINCFCSSTCESAKGLQANTETK